MTGLLNKRDSNSKLTRLNCSFEFFARQQAFFSRLPFSSVRQETLIVSRVRETSTFFHVEHENQLLFLVYEKQLNCFSKHEKQLILAADSSWQPPLGTIKIAPQDTPRAALGYHKDSTLTTDSCVCFHYLHRVVYRQL